MQLVEKRHLDARADRYRAGRRRQRAREQFQERGLARPVRSDDAYAFALEDVCGEIAHHRTAVAICERHVFRLDDAVAGRRRGVHAQRRRARRGATAREFQPQLAQSLHAALVAGAPRLHPLADPRLLLRELFRLLRPERRFVRLKIRLALQERPVVAIPSRERSAVEIVDICRDRLEKGAVVRDEKKSRFGLAPHERLQPFDGRHVEVVRRLVEQHEVWFVRKRARQQHAAAHPAGKRIELGGRVQPHLRHELAGTGDILYRAGAVGRHLLLEERRFQSGRADDFAGIRLDEPGDDFEQSGLPLAVAPGDAGAHAALHVQGYVVQNRTAPERHGYAAQGKKMPGHAQACGRGGSLWR